MSDESTARDAEVEVPPEEDPPSRIAGVIVAVVLASVAVLVLWWVVTVFPYVAYFVAGVIVCVAWQKAAAWSRRRRSGDGEDEEEELPDVGEALRGLSKGKHHVLLTVLRKRLGVADTKTVRKLLTAERITVRNGVRTPKGNGPGVHVSDIPPAPPESDGQHGDGCCCRSANNANANNEVPDPSQKGLRVEAIGHAGTIVRDLAETQQRRTQLGNLVGRFFDGAKQNQQDQEAGGQ